MVLVTAILYIVLQTIVIHLLDFKVTVSEIKKNQPIRHLFDTTKTNDPVLLRTTNGIFISAANYNYFLKQFIHKNCG